MIEIEGTRYPGASMRDFFDGKFEAWQDWATDDHDAGGFVLPLSPDGLHKANISGEWRVKQALSNGLLTL